ncbi:hypothetical protein ACIGEL_10665 [Rossellomorea aquimaris]|uniref:hypothetical protein n=1 Tax=Rossellomorea aquimaris TaxID=189382 RepID=UPI0037C84301
MSMYGLLVLVHIVAAVAGLGASLAMPVVMKTPETSHQAKFSLELSKKNRNLRKNRQYRVTYHCSHYGYYEPLFIQSRLVYRVHRNLHRCPVHRCRDHAEESEANG